VIPCFKFVPKFCGEPQDDTFGQKKYPHYGFEVHKGYGTKAHYKAIKKQGLSPEHRRSFLKGIKV